MIFPFVLSVSGGTQPPAFDNYSMQFTSAPGRDISLGDRETQEMSKSVSVQTYYGSPLTGRILDNLASAFMDRNTAVSAASREETLLSQIAEFVKMDDGWDGYGGYSPSASVCEYARGVVTRIGTEFPELPSPEINPTSNGTLTFSWEAPLGKASIEIGDEKFSAYVRYLDVFIPIKGECARLGINELQLISTFLYQ